MRQGPAAGSRTSNASRWEAVQEAGISFACTGLWIGLSALVIMFDRYILTYYGFPFPLTLAMAQNAFSYAASVVLVRSGFAARPEGMNQQLYMKAVAPVGVLWGLGLWLGATSYTHLSIALIQMIKAVMPLAVFVMGCLIGTEAFWLGTAANMVAVTVGGVFAAYGAVNMVLLGIFAESFAVAAEVFRLIFTQVLLQKRGLQLSPVAALYCVAPCCLAALSIPWAALELPRLLGSQNPFAFDPLLLLSNCAATFALNLSVFLLIERTSALTVTMADVVRGWLMAGLSVALYRSPVSGLNLQGHAIDLVAVCCYGYSRLSAAQQAGAAGTAASGGKRLTDIRREAAGREEEGIALVPRRTGSEMAPDRYRLQ